MNDELDKMAKKSHFDDLITGIYLIDCSANDFVAHFETAAIIQVFEVNRINRSH